MNEPHFEVFPEKKQAVLDEAGREPYLTGQFVWHFKDADGDITHTGSKPFTRREDAHRSIEDVAMAYCRLISRFGSSVATKAVLDQLPIVDLDADGEQIATG